MIDVRELRIGNIVNDDTNLAQEIGCKVVGIIESISEENIELKYLRSDGDTFYGEEHPRNLSPITLTEELRLKLGFSQMSNTDSDGKIKLSIFCDNDILYLTLNWNNYQIFKDPIKYLHQLQNIYFDLTGKELEVSL